MNKNDHSLGMDANITRRDFIDGVAQIIGGAAAVSMAGYASSPAAHAAAAATAPVAGFDYPPMRQGMRGFEDAAMEAGHALRDGKSFAPSADTGEVYDLVVVGSGMAGLSAAYFYRKQIPGAKILVLDSCDDFGGHARRVEFNVDGKQLLVCGGTQELWNPNTFSPESIQLLKDIGIDRDRYYQHTKADQDPFEKLGLGLGIFFDKETFGADQLAPNRPSIRGATAAQWREYLDKTPLSEDLKAGLIQLYTDKIDYLAGVPIEEKVRRLRKMSYVDYLNNVAKIHPDTVAYLVRNGSGDSDNQSAGPETYSAWYAWRKNLRGFDGLGLPPANQPSNLTKEPGEHIAFPDGNAGVARLLIRWMIPDALPGSTAEDSIPGRLNYDRLDLPTNDVRIRLSSMVARVTHLGNPLTAREVAVTYVREGRSYRVRANAAVMACFNSMIPYLVPDLPETQKAALRMAVRKPLVRSFVAIRNWSAFQKLGVNEILCPGMFHQYITPWIRPEWGGVYKNARDPSDPVIVYMRLSNTLLEMPGSGLPPREQWKAARAQLQAISFETMEHNIRSQLDRVLGPGGFNARRDIAGITVCRWSHGYAGGSNELSDPDWSHRTDAPWVVGRQRFGRIAISNSDAAATSLTAAAFAQSHRAVMEIVNDIVRPVYDFRWSERDSAGEPGDEAGRPTTRS
jgi:spermidine dehydrogenase